MVVLDLYARMSEAVDEAGVDRQLREMREWLSAHGHTEGRVFIDNDISATKGKRRPEFEDLLTARSEGILVWHLDRLVRVSKDLERVIDLNVNVHAVKSGHLDLSTPAGRAVARTVTAWSTYEGEQKAERQKSANVQRARDGKPMWTTRPFGFEKDGTLRTGEAEAVRAAYKGLLTGRPLSGLSAELNAAGHRTGRGNEWEPTALRLHLSNPRNAGIATYHGEEIGVGTWEPVVTEDVFRAALRLLRDPARRTGGGGARLYLLSGLAECVCGGAVKAAWREGKDSGYRVYTCRDRYCVSHRAEWADNYVAGEVLDRLSRPDAAAVFLAAPSNVEETRATVLALRARLDELAEDRAADLITREQFLAGTEKARVLLVEAESALAASGHGSVVADLIDARDIAQVWESMALDRQRAVLATLGLRVRLNRRGKGRRPMQNGDVDVLWPEMRAGRAA